MSSPQSTILSGIAPTGRLTLGNYLGALRSWVPLQREFRCYYALVDLHALTARQDPHTFAARCLDFAALFIACGIDPERSAVFVQSHVSEHAELAWILNCHTPLGELKRMTQFKDKSQRQAQNLNAGLFDYPVLMAADILLYQAAQVPVGEDQRQHLELTRTLAARFNRRYGAVFTLPSALLPTHGARVMSLQEPQKKMSKSDPNDGNVIALLDPPDRIAYKIRRALTDSGREVGTAEHAGVGNLLELLAALSGETRAAIAERYRSQGYGKLKTDLTECIVTTLLPLQTRYQHIRADEAGLHRYLERGAARARAQAQQTLSIVTAALGLLPRRCQA
jgi:tryptophanyl-tRNA synthetase